VEDVTRRELGEGEARVSDSMKTEAAVAVVVDLPPPPRSVEDGVAIFACEEHGFLTTVRDPPKGPRPVCPVCGQRAMHVGPATAKSILDRSGA